MLFGNEVGIRRNRKKQEEPRTEIDGQYYLGIVAQSHCTILCKCFDSIILPIGHYLGIERVTNLRRLRKRLFSKKARGVWSK